MPPAKPDRLKRALLDRIGSLPSQDLLKNSLTRQVLENPIQLV